MTMIVEMLMIIIYRE